MWLLRFTRIKNLFQCSSVKRRYLRRVMPSPEFIEQLKEAGYQPESFGDNRVVFDYKVEVGRFKGNTVKLGFEVQDFPLSPPSGPHINPRILPINPSAEKHPERVAESPFGPDWEYWSRPYHDWHKTSKTVIAYLRHIRNLWETQ